MREITRNPLERKPNASPDIKPNFDSFYFASQPKSDYFCHHFEPNTVPKEKILQALDLRHSSSDELPLQSHTCLG